MIGVPAAIGNAIADATGVDIHDLPMNPQNVWKTINKAKHEHVGEADAETEKHNLRWSSGAAGSKVDF